MSEIYISTKMGEDGPAWFHPQQDMWWSNDYAFSWDVDLTGKLQAGKDLLTLRIHSPHHFGGMFRRPFLYSPVHPRAIPSEFATERFMSSTGPVQRPVSLAHPPARADAPAWIRGLTLHTLDPDREASVAMASIPLPRDNHALVAFAGMASQALPIAWYPAAQDAEPAHPRQVRVLGIVEGGAPDALGLVAAGDRAIVTPQPVAAPATADPAWGGPTWESVIVEEKKTGLQMREMNELVFAHAGRRLGIRLGIELTSGGYHWWEWLCAGHRVARPRRSPPRHAARWRAHRHLSWRPRHGRPARYGSQFRPRQPRASRAHPLRR